MIIKEDEQGGRTDEEEREKEIRHGNRCKTEGLEGPITSRDHVNLYSRE